MAETAAQVPVPAAGAARAAAVNVFVSYSRADLARAQRLVAALEQRGIRCVIDTRDLPYGEKWQNELKGFLRASDTVLFLVSPVSIGSQWCQWELAQVASLSKRLVPVVLQAVPPEQLPAAVGEVHLFPLDDEAAFDGRVDALVQVLLTDRAWIRDHTRLGERAGQWLAAGRADDHLLTGHALREAEAWLQRRPAAAPPPSQEQLDYIMAGQARAKRRTRWTVMALSAVVVGALALSALAWWQRDAAVDARALAEQQRDRAVATAYAARLSQAESEFDAQRTASGLDILDSLQPAAGEPDLRGFEWYALWGRLHDDLLWLRPNGAPVTGLAVHPTEPVIATTAPRRGQPAQDAHIELWDSRSGARLGELPGHPRGTQSLAFSPDGRWLVSGGLNDGSVLLWDWRERRLERTLAAATERSSTVQLLRFMPDGQAVVASVEPLNCSTDSRSCTLMYFGRRATLLPLQADAGAPRRLGGDHRSVAALPGPVWLGHGRRLQRVDPAASAAAPPLEVPDNFAAALAASPDGRMLAVGGDKLQVLDAADGRLLATLPAQPGRVTALAYAQDGRWLYSGHAGGVVHVWRTDTHERIGAFEGHRDDVLALAALADPGRVVSASADGSVRVWDVTRLQPRAQSSGSDLVVAATGGLAALNDGGASVGRIVVGSETGLRLFDLELRRDVAARDAATSHHQPLGFAAGGGSFWFRDGATEGLARLQPGGCAAPAAAAASASASSPGGRPLAMARDGTWMLAEAGDGLIVLHDLAAGAVVARWRPPGARIDDVVLDPEGRLLVVRAGYPASAAVHAAPEWATPRHVQGAVQGALVAADGRRVLLWPERGGAASAASAPTQPLLLEPASAHRWPMPVADVAAAAWSAGGQRIALADNKGAIHLYASEPGQAPRRLAVLKADLQPVHALRFSDDGRRLFSGGEEGRLRIWDATHGLELGRVDIRRGRILALATAERAAALGVASFRDDVREVRWLYVPTPAEVALRRLRAHDAAVDRAWAGVQQAPGAAAAAGLRRALEAAGADAAALVPQVGELVRRALMGQLRGLDDPSGERATARLGAADVRDLLGAADTARLAAHLAQATALQAGAEARAQEAQARDHAEAGRVDEADRSQAAAAAALQRQQRLSGCMPPRLVEVLLDLGVRRYLAGRLDAAAQAWQAATVVAPGDARPWGNLGFVHFERSAYAAALGAFERALALDRRAADAWGGQAIALWRLERADAALESMREAIRIDPRYGRVEGLREAAQWSAAQTEAAQELLQRLR